MFKMILLLPVLLLLVESPLFAPQLRCEASEFYVTPTQPLSSACPDEKPCYTLSDYASNASFLFNNKDDVSLLFLDGQHVLTNQTLELSNIQNLTIAGVNDFFSIYNPRVTIHATAIIISNVTVLKIQNISITAPYGNDRGSMLINDVGHLLNDQVIITNISLEVETPITTTLTKTYLHNVVYVLERPFPLFDASIHTKLTIEGCTVMDSTLLIIPGYFLEGEVYDTLVHGGEGLIFIVGEGQLTVQRSNISSTSSGLTVQIFRFGGPLDSSFDIELKNCIIYQNLPGVLVFIGSQVRSTLAISNCSFSNNQAEIYVYDGGENFYLSVHDTFFSHQNSEFNGLAFKYRNVWLTGNKTLLLKNVVFFNNHVINSAPLSVEGPVNMTVDNCSFLGNSGISTILLHLVNVLFVGENMFSENSGSTGGALYLATTTMHLDNGTSITFENNTAGNVGGAIYVKELRQQNILDETFTNSLIPTSNPRECFYQLTYNVSLEDRNQLNAAVVFKNNSAKNGGDNIYGASLKDQCSVTPDKQTRSYQIQSKLFDFHNQTLSSLSSNPRRVCLCENGKPQCANPDYIFKSIQSTSGEKFNLSVVLVGDDFGTVSGGIFASKLNENFTFGSKQRLQHLTQTKECTDLEYSVHSKNPEVVFILSLDSITALSQHDLLATPYFSRSTIERASIVYNTSNLISLELLNVPVIINVTISPCPFGFTLNGTKPSCQCEQFLLEYVHDCTVTNQRGFVYRNGRSWVSSFNESDGINETDIYLAYEYCPFNYCNTDNIAVDLYQPDTQCAFQRSGILCGGCATNLSLALGSSQCLECSNDGHIALLLVFVAAGVALVLFIKILDLTVAQGTINGLIFYANIIWLYRPIFFPIVNMKTNRELVQFMTFLKVFTAWLNLDLEIQTCFFKGLDTYVKAWLQFVFPTYLWFIAGMIILACRYSTRVTKLFGNNAVSVLATIFLISYLKLIRIILGIVAFVDVRRSYPEEIMRMWWLDGTVPFLGESHIYLFLAGLFTLIFLCVPYTLTLLLVPYLKTKAHKLRILHWINYLKPLFDSYYGPLKDKPVFQNWIGVTILARAILPILRSLGTPVTNLIAVAAVSAFLCIPVTHVYKKLYNALLEASFLFNLTVVSILFVSTDDTDTRIKYICASVFISFVTFVGIIIFNILSTVFNKCCPNRKLSFKTKAKEQRNERRQHTSSVTNDFVTVTSIALRESLLESTFHN